MPFLPRPRSLLAIIAIFSAATPLAAQAPGQSPSTINHASHTIPVPRTVAALRTGDVRIDGRLDEGAWNAASPITELRQFDPETGSPASERTEVRFLFDDKALYVGARMWDRNGAAGVRTTVVRRDAEFNSDYFEVVIDGVHDHLSRAFFQVNPSGSRLDQLGIGTSCCDSGWDPVWSASTHVDSAGWTAEIRIPFSQLRYSRGSDQTWGLQVRRFIHRRNESAQWSYWGKDETGGPARFGHLDGLNLNQSPRHIELLPYVMTKSSHLLASPGDPFNDGSRRSAQVGLDLRYKLTSTVTLDATINPDFGQVEVDPAVVNLSAFETFFEERRPFFVSGSGVFDFGGFSCFFCSNVSSLQAFYSRRVGRAPTGSELATDAGLYADVPESAPILGAAKITGRTGNGFTIGVMDAVTGSAEADVQLNDGSRLSQEVEPRANYFVGRVKKDFMDGDLVLGLIGTNVVRNLTPVFVPRLAKHAELVGGDFQYMWDNRAYMLDGNLAFSNVSGDPQVIYERQLSSARFFQRLDREPGTGGIFSPRLDPTATSMRGAGGYLRIAREAGDWRYESSVSFRSPGFETNDYSFLTQADYIWNNLNVLRYWTAPTSWYRDLTIIVGGQRQQNFDGDVTPGTQLQAFVSSQTPGFWNWNLFHIHRPKGLYDDRLLRGGPSVKSVATEFTSVEVATDSRKSWRLSANPGYGSNTAGGHSAEFSMGATFRPSSRLRIALEPSWNNGRSKFHYIGAFDDPTAASFGGVRYVVADLHQRQLSLNTRLNVTFSPAMTLEMFAQPFIASQRHSDFKEFVSPRDAAFSVFGRDVGTVTTTTDVDGDVTSYSIDPDAGGPAAPFSFSNPDFNRRSLRGNVVFRWEYRPGSTLFFAWTQSRLHETDTGEFDFRRDGRALFTTRPDNIFLIKASWWLAR